MKFLYLCFLSVLTNQGVALADCQANNCLRAVRASKSVTQRLSDCVSYLHTTVTPPQVTHTSTLSFTSTSIVLSTTVIFQTSFETLTNSQSATLTETFFSTITNTVSFTSTTTIQATITNTSPATTTVIQPITTTVTSTVGGGGVTLKKVKKRIVTEPGVPAYASPCSNLAAYVSACSCQGVTRSTTTVPTPSTTITVSSTSILPVINPITVTSTTAHTNATVTKTITIATASITLPTTVSTSYTQWLTETNTNTVVTTSTGTITVSSAVATTTVVAPFYIQISGGTWNGNWIQADTANGATVVVTSKSDASLWTLDGSNYLISGGLYGYSSSNPAYNVNYLWLGPLSLIETYYGGIAVCSINPSSILTCTAQGNGYNTFARCIDNNFDNRGSLCLGTAAAVAAGTLGMVGVTLKAIAA
ncbi:hypothetical protein AA313_de0209847 [Arthrobotrys entomopaga]|nr:hypothetical protein AA313_de0209847 [Arthrobotrys entomopaga]